MNKYHEPWSTGKYSSWDAIEGDLPEEMIQKINEVKAKQVYCLYRGEMPQRITNANDARIARRIVLCVNACQGLTDEALERNLVKRGVRYLWDEYEEASCSLDDDMETSVWENEDGK